MTLAAPISPAGRPIVVVYSRIANALVIREPGPPAPVLSAVHLALDFLASMAGAFLMTIGVAFLIGAVRWA